MPVKLGTKLTESQKRQRAATRTKNRSSGYRNPKNTYNPNDVVKNREKRKDRERRRALRGLPKR